MGTVIKDIIKDENLKEIAKSVKPDDRNRITIAKALLAKEDVTYHIYVNSYGQIILDPQITIPASEAWIFRNPEILALAKEGLKAAAEGDVSEIDLDSL